MNEILKQIIQSVLFGMVLPSALVNTVETVTVKTPEPEASVQETVQSDPDQVMIPVLLDTGEVELMELEEYVSRVVLGEVPTSFETEALKAQAVAARTYTLYCGQASARHAEGAVCTDYRCCQAYRDPQDYLENGGTVEALERVRQAVKDTAGEVLCYDGKLIVATYFASSGGVTEDAEEVWGQAYPYLTSVESPGEEDSAYYEDTKTFTAQEFQERLGVTLNGSPETWFGRVYGSLGGGVGVMRIGGRLYGGTEIRSLFGLRSTIFTVTTTADSVTFHTKGYGHRVGMSQYGADAMAVNGSTYQEILAHYYTGTTLEQYQPNSD